MSDAKNKTRRALLVTAAAWMAILAVPSPASAAPTAAPVLVAAAEHKHDWQRVSKRKWIPATQTRVMVGKDKNGKPVYEMKTVKPGRWEIEYKSRCRKCGKTKKG